MAAGSGTTREDLERLRARIHAADHAYYVLDRPRMPDEEYDRLYRELVRLEAEHPAWADANSPTQRVPGAVADGIRPFPHPVPMVSLDNVTSETEVREWETSLRAFLNAAPDAPIGYACEPKVDGMSLELVYERGRLVAAATRGDGSVGEDLTANARLLRSIPLVLHDPAPPAYVAVRGEAYARKDDSRAHNARLEAEGGEPFANPRNFCAGSLRQLDPSVVAGLPIRYLAYAIAKVEGRAFARQAEVLDALRAWGLPVGDRNVVAPTLDAVVAAFRGLEAERDAIPYEIDGVVLKVDDLALQARLGMRTRSPRWAVAWKFPTRKAVTRLRDVAWSVGRTGVVSPVAVLEPVALGGVTISSATLHNEDEVKRLDVRVGDRVVIERAGDVIPKVLEALVGERTGEERTLVAPTACPSCHAPLGRDDDRVALRCRNVACPAQVERNILHFVSRGGLDVQGVGPKQIHQFREAGLLTDASDLWRLSKDALVALDRQGETSAANLVARLAAASRPPLDRFLFALGIPEVGERGARTLARAFRTLDALAAADADAIDELDEVGPAMAASVHGWFHEPRNLRFLERLAEVGVSPLAVAADASTEGGPLAGTTVVFTGSLPSLSRDEAKHRAETAGAKVASSLSKRTTLLVAGAEPGSKLKKARELGVEVVDEAEFLRRLTGVSAGGPGGAIDAPAASNGA